MAIRNVIDVHTHHYPDAYLRACQRDGSGLSTYYRDDGRLVVAQDGAVALAVPQPLPSLEERLAEMREVGVAKQVLSVSAPNVYSFPQRERMSLVRELNAEFSDLVDAGDGQLAFFASLPLPDVEASLEELTRIRHHPGAVGVVVCTTVAGHTLDEPLFSPLWAELSELGSTVFVHPTVACCTDGLKEYALALALDFMAETTNAVGRLVYSGTTERYPGIRWIFTHLGGTVPFLAPRFDNYYRQFPECRANITRPPTEILRTLYFDTCTMHPPALTCALDTLGAGRLVFGSDYPHVPGGIGRFMDILESQNLPAGQLAMIEWETAARLLASWAGGSPSVDYRERARPPADV